jgi:type I restriction enzyme S subunit
LNTGIVKALMVPLPPTAEQQAINQEVERQMSVIRASEDYIDASLKRASRLRQSILKEAFAGRLVPQDPNDETASVLLDRIRRSRTEANGPAAVARPTRTRRARKQESSPELFEGPVDGED